MKIVKPKGDIGYWQGETPKRVRDRHDDDFAAKPEGSNGGLTGGGQRLYNYRLIAGFMVFKTPNHPKQGALT